MNFDIDKPLLKSLLIIGDVIEARDTYTGGHVWRVSQYAKLLGKQIGLSQDDITRVSIGGYLHDLGKVGISDSILRKKSGLDGNEFDTLKTHPTIGGKLIEAHPLAELALDVILHHHEQLDGKGYPFGLDGDSISLFPRLIAVADAFDAMTSTRPYRKGLPVEEAMKRLDESSGSHFDPNAVTAIKELDRKGQLTHIISHSDEGIPLIPCTTCDAIIIVTRETKDGDLTNCRTCTAEHRLHQRGDTFDAEFTGNMGKPEDVQPQPDLGMIQNLVEQTPKRIKL